MKKAALSHTRSHNSPRHSTEHACAHPGASPLLPTAGSCPALPRWHSLTEVSGVTVEGWQFLEPWELAWSGEDAVLVSPVLNP